MGQKEAAGTKSLVEPSLKAMIRERIKAMQQQLRANQLDSSNKRRGIRHAFPHTQRITAHNDSFPNGATFYEVQCQDISTTGFSYRALRPPIFSQLVVELGIAPNYVYVSARIVRTVSQPDGSYLIGCEFVGRVAS